MSSASIIGIDFGGTKTALARYELPDMIRRELVVIPTDADKGFEDVRQRLLQELLLLRTPDTVAIGIGVPGLVDSSTGLVLKMPNVLSEKGTQILPFGPRHIRHFEHESGGGIHQSRHADANGDCIRRTQQQELLQQSLTYVFESFVGICRNDHQLSTNHVGQLVACQRRLGATEVNADDRG
jgi:hypothetical protein